jgi:hypothetical protein
MKEIVHHKAYSKNRPAETNPVGWPTGEMPKFRWIGYKLIVRNVSGGVNLQLWHDYTNGVNGGRWQKVAEFTDVGNWGDRWDTSYDVRANCGYDPNVVLSSPATSVYIRTTGVSESSQIRYSRISIREIQP